jgi:hypothetical protein
MELPKTFKEYGDVYVTFAILISVGLIILVGIYAWMFPSTPSQADPLLQLKLVELSFAAGIFSGVASGICTGQLIVLYQYQKTKKIKFIESHEKLQNEIKANILKLKQFRIELDKLQKKWLDSNDKVLHWSPKSVNPIRSMMQYLSTKEYDYFISLDNPELDLGRIERLFNFYFLCGNFSAASQSIEKAINDYRVLYKHDDDVNYKLFVNSQCNQLNQLYWLYYKAINDEYLGLNPLDRIDLDFEKDIYFEWPKKIN